MTSSTKPEVDDMLHCRPRTEPRPQVTRTESFVTLKYATQRTDIQTDTLFAILRLSQGSEITAAKLCFVIRVIMYFGTLGVRHEVK